MHKEQGTTASKEKFSGFYVPPAVTESLARSVEHGSFNLSAILYLPNGDVALISAQFRSDELGVITGFIEPDVDILPISELLTTHERQHSTLSCVTVSDEFASTAMICDVANPRRTLEIETKIVDAVMGALNEHPVMK